MRIALALLLLAGLQDKNPTDVDELPAQVRDQMGKAIKDQDWEAAAKLYTSVVTRHASKLVRRGDGYVPALTWLESACDRLPEEFRWAFEKELWTAGHPTVAQARAAGAWDLERLSRKAPFGAETRALMGEAGTVHLASDRPRAAIRCFRIALARLKADDEQGRAVLVGRLAQAAVRAGDDRELAWARTAGKDLAFEIVVDGKQIGLQAYLASLAIPGEEPNIEKVKTPAIPEAGDRVARPRWLRNELRRGTFDLVHNRNSATMGDHPTGAASAIVGRRQVALVTDGLQAICFDPAAVGPQKSGVLWRHPEKGPNNRPVPNAIKDVPSMSRFGATIAAGRAYVTLFGAGQGPIAADGWDGCREIACFDALTGRLQWQTDPATLAVLEFGARNWAFTGAPVVVGGIVVVAVVTAPPNAECHVVGLEAATGKVAWSRFVASKRIDSPWVWPSRRPAMSAAEDVVLVASNLGVVAALQAASGDPLWMTTYESTTGPGARPGFRWESAPLVHRTGVYVLPQDANALLKLDLRSGEGGPIQTSSANKELKWRDVDQLVGSQGDWLVLGGVDSHVVNLVDRVDRDGRLRIPAMKPYVLPMSNTVARGRSAVDGQSILLSVAGRDRGSLSTYFGVGSFKNVDQRAWDSADDRGNLVPAGSFLVVASAGRVSVYCGIDTIRAMFDARLGQSPPDVAAWAEFAEIVAGTPMRIETADAVAGYVEAARGDATHEAKARKLAGTWFATLRQEGIDARNAEPPVFHLAASLWRAAAKLAPDEAAKVELAERRLEVLEQWARQAYGGQRDAIENEAAELRRLLKKEE